MRTLIGGCLATLLVSTSAAAQSSPAGNWTGTYNYSIQLSACSNQTFTSSGNIAFTLLQTGTSLSGRVDLTNFFIFSDSCTPTAGELTRVVVGTISGSTIALGIPNDANVTQFIGSIDGNSITAQIADDVGGGGSLSLTRTSGDPPALDLTGAWSGNYTFSDVCPNGSAKSYTGQFTLGLAQSGANAGGVVTMQNVPLYDQNCNTLSLLNMALVTVGVVSGSTFTGGVYDPSGSFEFPITATISNGAMSGTVAGASETSTTGTFTATQGSAAAPASDSSGTYTGSYNETDDETSFCLNIPSLSFNGPASLTLVQAGDVISGWLTFHGAEDITSDGVGDCVEVDAGDEVLPLYGTLAGGTLTLLLDFGGGVQQQFIYNFSGETISGTVDDTYGDTASFTTTLSASAAPPVINNFGASPSAIFAGQSATLSWSTSNATAVSIDNGVGLQPATGSVTVSPAQITVYTLTATGPAGSVSAQTTIEVDPPGPKRRVAQP